MNLKKKWNWKMVSFDKFTLSSYICLIIPNKKFLQFLFLFKFITIVNYIAYKCIFSDVYLCEQVLRWKTLQLFGCNVTRLVLKIKVECCIKKFKFSTFRSCRIGMKHTLATGPALHNLPPIGKKKYWKRWLNAI